MQTAKRNEKEKLEKSCMVGVSHTVVYPRAVMIHLINTPVTASSGSTCIGRKVYTVYVHTCHTVDSGVIWEA